MATDARDGKRSLFVLNIDKRVTDEILYELFLQAGPMELCCVNNAARSSHGVVVYKHPCSVSYATDLFKGTRLFDRELVLSNDPGTVEPDNHGQAALRGYGMNHHRHHQNDYNRNNGWRDNRSDRHRHDGRRERIEPYSNSEYRRRHDDRHFREHNRSHDRKRWR